jgi:hypothetical protein
MLIDSKMVLGEALDIASAGLIGNVIDLAAAGVDGWGNTITESPGDGQTLYLVVQVDTIIETAGVTLELCFDETLSGSNLAASTDPIVTLELPTNSPVGWRRTVTVPSGGAGRYVQLFAVDLGGSPTGNIDAFLTTTPGDSEVAYK